MAPSCDLVMRNPSCHVLVDEPGSEGWADGGRRTDALAGVPGRGLAPGPSRGLYTDRQLDPLTWSRTGKVAELTLKLLPLLKDTSWKHPRSSPAGTVLHPFCDPIARFRGFVLTLVTWHVSSSFPGVCCSAGTGCSLWQDLPSFPPAVFPLPGVQPDQRGVQSPSNE